MDLVAEGYKVVSDILLATLLKKKKHQFPFLFSLSLASSKDLQKPHAILLQKNTALLGGWEGWVSK